METLLPLPKRKSMTDEFLTDLFDLGFRKVITVDNRNTDIFRRSMENYVPDLRHDCMWAGSCESAIHQGICSYNIDNEQFDPSFSPRNMELDVTNLFSDHCYFKTSFDPSNSKEPEEVMDLFSDHCHFKSAWDDDEDFVASLSERSSHLNGTDICQEHPLESPQQQQSSSDQRSFSSSQVSSSTTHAIQGIVLKDKIPEDSSTRKTKILVPLKALMETLQQNSFLVSPCGTGGKLVLEYTGNGETVQGVFDLNGTKFKTTTTLSTSSVGISSSSNILPTSGSVGKVCPRKAPSKKKTVHKPKRELSPSPPVSTCSLSSLSTSNVCKPAKKTTAHKNTERERRIDLRNSFEDLKNLVPILSKATKCSKVEILRRTHEHILSVQAYENRLLRDEHILKVKNASLRKRAVYLSSRRNHKV